MDINEEILEAIRTLDHSILSIGLSLVKIKREKLFREMGFRNISAYVAYLTEQSKKNRSSIYKWLQIGEIYLKYQDDLAGVDFSGSDSPTKLPYLERALAGNPKDEVYINLKKMSQREFVSYAKHNNFAKATGSGDHVNENAINSPAESAQGLGQNETINDWGHSFYYRGLEAVRVNKLLPRRILKMLLPAIRLSFNALDRKSYVVAVHLDSYREYIRFKDIAIEAREQMRHQRFFKSR